MSASFPVVVTIPVLWGDLDALGHVNNARYFTWFEAARIELARAVGWSIDGKGTGPVLASAQCDYVKPVHFPGTVCVGARVAKVGTTSVTMEYAVWMEGRPGDVHARSTSVVVLVDYATMKKVQIADDTRRALLSAAPAP